MLHPSCFLNIVTRHLAGRPLLLRQNQASLASLESDGWKQTLLIDDVGRGVKWANRNLKTHTPAGEWVWVLDDDDVCTMPNLIQELEAVVKAQPNAKIVIAQADVTTHVGHIVPSHSWGTRPTYCDIAMPCLFFKASTWVEYSNAWAQEIAADYRMADHVWTAIGGNEATVWWDAIVARSTQVGNGRPE